MNGDLVIIPGGNDKSAAGFGFCGQETIQRQSAKEIHRVTGETPEPLARLLSEQILHAWDAVARKERNPRMTCYQRSQHLQLQLDFTLIVNAVITILLFYHSRLVYVHFKNQKAFIYKCDCTLVYIFKCSDTTMR